MTSGPQEGWWPDPTGRHQHRYHDGRSWTGSVANDDEVTWEPLQAANGSDPGIPSERAAPSTDDMVGELPDVPAEPTKRYSAFVSYSHAADGLFAPTLQKGLQRLAKSWRQRRALEIFRDDTGLSVNPHLWTSICHAMDGADWFVLLASAESTRSDWVGKEIERWVATRGADRILPVVTDGTWTWDADKGDFAWDDPEAVTAVHPALGGVFSEEPRHVDMSWAKGSTDLTLRNPRFRDQIAELAAPMHGKTKDELESEDIHQQRRTKRLTTGAVATLIVLTIFSLAAGATAVMKQREAAAQRNRASAQARSALSQKLAVKSTSNPGMLPDRRLLTAVAADRIESSPQTQGALTASLLAEPNLKALLGGHAGGVADLDTSHNGASAVTVDGAGAVRIWDVKTGELAAGPLDLDADSARLSEGGDTAVAFDRHGTAKWIDATDGGVRAEVDVLGKHRASTICDSFGCGRYRIAVDPDGETIAVAVEAGEKGALRFAHSDGSVDTVESSDPITGLAWSPTDPDLLVVADTVGMRAWSGEKGPPRGTRRIPFTGASGFVPGGTAFNSNGTRFAYVAELNGFPEAIGELAVSEGGALDDVGHMTSLADLDVSIGAIAFDGFVGLDERLLVGSDPTLGGPSTPLLISVSDGRRTLETRIARPLGTITRLAGTRSGELLIGGLDEMVRVDGAGPVLDVVDGKSGRRAKDAVTKDTVDALPSESGREVSAAATSDTRTAAVYSPPRERTVIDTTGQVQMNIESQIPHGVVRLFEDGEDVTRGALGDEALATTVAFQKDTGNLLVGTAQGLVEVFDVESGERLDRVAVANAPISVLDASPDGSWLAVQTPYELFLLDSQGFDRAATLVQSDGAGRGVGQALFSARNTVNDIGRWWMADGSLEFARLHDVGAATSDPFDPSRVPQGPFTGTPAGGDQAEDPSEDGLTSALANGTLVAQAPLLPGSELHPVTYRVRLDDLADLACEVAGRNLTKLEWARIVGSAPYREICPDEPTPTEQPAPVPTTSPADGAATTAPDSSPSSKTPSRGVPSPPTSARSFSSDEPTIDSDAQSEIDGFFSGLSEMTPGPGSSTLEYVGSCDGVDPAADETCAVIIDHSPTQVIALLKTGNGLTDLVVRAQRKGDQWKTDGLWYQGRTDEATHTWVLPYLDKIEAAGRSRPTTSTRIDDGD